MTSTTAKLFSEDLKRLRRIPFTGNRVVDSRLTVADRLRLLLDRVEKADPAAREGEGDTDE